MKKLLALLLAAMMIMSMVACGPANTNPTETNKNVEYVDPFKDIADYDELSAAVYDLVLGDFYEAYQAAAAEKDVATRYAKMAIAEAKLLGAGIFLPTTSQGGNYAMTKIAPYTNTPILYGNDTYRFHNRVVTKEPIEAAHVAEMKAKWNEVIGTGTYEQWVKSYLADKGYAMPFATDTDDAVNSIVGGTGTLPQTIVLNRRGEVIYNQIGSVTPEVLAALYDEADK